MAEHFKSFSAVFPVIFNEKGEVLLAKRDNTGYMDGKWDLAGSGHVDEGESATEALLREAKEELNITIRAEDVEFSHLSHRVGKNGNRTYYDIYFRVKKFSGTPEIAEKEKCSALSWFGINALPDYMIGIRRDALYSIRGGITYSEIVNEIN